MLALTHLPSPRIADCLVTYVERSAIDIDRALRQHAAYCDALRDYGAEVRTLNVNRNLPDSTFIEDTAVVLDDVALIARPGAAARRAETEGIETELRKYRPVERIAAPATLEGGDVLRVGGVLLVGLSSRTSPAGAAALDAVVRRFGYTVRTVPIHGCLHLKTACTALPDRRLLINRTWLDVEALRGFELIEVPAAEPFGANIACLGERVLAGAEHAQTADLIRGMGFELRTVELDEFAKAEGGVTCLSLLLA
ncbi:MAG: dimethylarginine dimethylaminohydrolase family protein [Deltaproteobacteria bacterium]